MPTGIQQLPDGVLESIFGLLDPTGSRPPALVRLGAQSTLPVVLREGWEPRVTACQPAEAASARRTAGSGAATASDACAVKGWVALCSAGCPVACRHRTVPLVCQRWNQAAHSPPLLRSLSASIDGHSGKRFRRRLQSLCGWLRQVSAAHVRELRLTVQPRGPRLSVKRHRRLTEQQLQDCAAELADSLAACSRLEALDLSLGFEYDLSRCVAPLHSLRRLDTDALSGCDAVRLSESLGHLTALEHLRLDVGEELDIDWQDPSIHLPPFLTSLEVANDAGIETRFSMDLMFPDQVSLATQQTVQSLKLGQ